MSATATVKATRRLSWRSLVATKAGRPRGAGAHHVEFGGKIEADGIRAAL
jgi:hypothetical protein